MSNSKQMPTSPARVWNAPRVVRIGTIADVAGKQSAGPQGGGAKS